MTTWQKELTVPGSFLPCFTMPIVVYLHAVIDPNMHLDVSMSGRERIGYGKCMNFPFLFDVGDHELSAFFSVVQFFMSPYG